MITHSLIQGTPEWLAYRATHFNASDAPAMMGVSPYKSRTQLLHEMHTGYTPEVDAATQRRFDDGHRFEALARPLAEKIIGEDLYPVTGAEGKLSASFDGLTMAEDTGFEHKTLNDSLRACMRDEGNGYGLPMHYQIQMEQQLMVSGAERILFMASKWSGNELLEELHCWYASDAKIRSDILQGWTQFAIDLAAYVPPEVIVPAIAAPQMGLPAVSITVNGSIALVDNLEKFGTALTAYVGRINKTPETDQDFADLEATVKTLQEAEKALDAAESGALAQTDSIDTMRKTVALYRETARTNRLLVQNLVKAEKENRRTAIVSDAAAGLVAHVRKLNERLGKPYMPSIAADFQGVIKGLKSLDSMKDKVATELARAKIAANEAADRIQANLSTLRELASGHVFLFADAAQLVGKANDDLTALVKQRITEHQAAEAAKEEAQRARIRAEEQAKAESEARAKLAAEQEAAAQQERDRLASVAQAELEVKQVPHGMESAQAAIETVAQSLPITHEAVAKIMMPPAVRQAMAPKAGTPPTLTLGEISTRLDFNVTSAFLATLGFEATTMKAAKLYCSSDFKAICEAIKTHIDEVIDQHEEVLA